MWKQKRTKPKSLAERLKNLFYSLMLFVICVFVFKEVMRTIAVTPLAQNTANGLKNAYQKQQAAQAALEEARKQELLSPSTAKVTAAEASD